MYKLFVVDDDFHIRNTIAYDIPWDEIGVKVIGTAIDGDDAEKKIDLYSPDIIITDISMDNIDGLELTDMLRHKYPFIKVIIISGYSDFEYVKRALDLKVFTYISKPVRVNELVETVRRLISSMREEKALQEKIQLMEQEIDRNNALLIERFLTDLIQGNIVSHDELQMRMSFLDIKFDKRFYTCILINISESHEIIRKYGIKKLLSIKFSMHEIINNVMKEYEIQSLTDGSASLTVLVGSDSLQSDIYHEKLTEDLEHLAAYIYKLLAITVAITIGKIYKDLLEIYKSFGEAMLAAEYSAISGKAGITHINDVSASTSGNNCIYPVNKENMLLRCLVEPDEERTEAIIKDLLDEMDRYGYSRNRIRIDVMELLGKISKRAMDLGVDMYQIYNRDLLDLHTTFERYTARDQIENWLKNIIVKTANEIRNQHASNIKSVIIKANEYINENYTNPNLTLASLSNHVFLNASYFSWLYKRETGNSFIEVLTRLRIEKSKKLLKESNEKITVVSEKVGYPDAKYFSTVFKKNTGLSPMEFREI